MNKNPKILFIVHDLYQEDNHFPMGPAYMSSILKQKGFEVEMYCQDIFHYPNEKLADFLEEKNFDIIGIGFMAARFRETISGLCETINQKKRNGWLVLGGPGPSPIPEYMLRTTGADIVVLGEAEETIVELAEAKKEERDLSGIKGIAWREGSEIRINPRRKPVFKLDSIPFPDWSSFPMEKYKNCLQPLRATKEDKVLGLLTSRGCVNRCNFCYRMEQGIRFRSVDNVVEEMKILKESYGINYFIMYDELFVVPKERIFQLKETLDKNNLKIKFSCNARVDIFDEELAECLKEIGCQFLNFGFESSSQEVLDLMHKNTTVEQNIQAIEISREVGIELGLNFIWGNKGDTAETLKRNVELIKQYNTYDQLRTIRPVTPYPGCPLYYEAIRKGLLSGPADFFRKFKNSDLLTVNFTNIPEKDFYKLLFQANKELILDHFQHTTGNMAEAQELIQQFYDLYFRGKIKFRGARHYDKKK